jgi:hypothetical protein
MMAKAKKKKPKLGSGARFKALKNKLARKSKANKKVRDPGALAAYIGRKKYGKKKFAKLGAKGRKRARKK